MSLESEPGRRAAEAGDPAAGLRGPQPEGRHLHRGRRPRGPRPALRRRATSGSTRSPRGTTSAAIVREAAAGAATWSSPPAGTAPSRPWPTAWSAPRPPWGSSRWGRPTSWPASWASRSTWRGRRSAPCVAGSLAGPSTRSPDRRDAGRRPALLHAGRRRHRRPDDPRHRRRAQAAVRPGGLPLDGRDPAGRVPAPAVHAHRRRPDDRGRASQVVVANVGMLGQPPFRWGPDIRPDDGRIDVCVVRARTGLDYLRLPGTSSAASTRQTPTSATRRPGPSHRREAPPAGPGRRRDHRRDPGTDRGRRPRLAGRRPGRSWGRRAGCPDRTPRPETGLDGIDRSSPEKSEEPQLTGARPLYTLTFPARVVASGVEEARQQPVRRTH